MRADRWSSQTLTTFSKPNLSFASRTDRAAVLPCTYRRVSPGFSLARFSFRPTVPPQLAPSNLQPCCCSAPLLLRRVPADTPSAPLTPPLRKVIYGQFYTHQSSLSKTPPHITNDTFDHKLRIKCICYLSYIINCIINDYIIKYNIKYSFTVPWLVRAQRIYVSQRSYRFILALKSEV